MKSPLVFKLFSIFLTATHGREIVELEEPNLGYVTVRPGAHMFWWLCTTTAEVPNPTDRPLVLWINGNPDEASLNTAKTWLKDVNLLFIDCPVGTGFSYVDNDSYLARNDEEAARDLIVGVLGFFQKHPEFRNVPLYVSSEDNNEKMVTEFAIQVHELNKFNRNILKLVGVTFLGPYAAPVNTVLTLSSYFYSNIISQIENNNENSFAAEETENLTSITLNKNKLPLAIEMLLYSNDPLRATGLFANKVINKRNILNYTEEKIEEILDSDAVQPIVDVGSKIGLETYFGILAARSKIIEPVIGLTNDALNGTNVVAHKAVDVVIPKKILSNSSNNKDPVDT